MAPTRRQLFAGAAALAAAPAGQAQAQAAAPAINPGRRAKQPNLLFVFTDQERYMPAWPKGLSLPGHERLAGGGVTFHNPVSYTHLDVYKRQALGCNTTGTRAAAGPDGCCRP